MHYICVIDYETVYKLLLFVLLNITESRGKRKARNRNYFGPENQKMHICKLTLLFLGKKGGENHTDSATQSVSLLYNY